MSTALLQELHQEVRRLFVAGSDLAPGDFRLKRLLPQFQQLGERAAVFKKLGEGISSVLEPAEGQGQSSAMKLQDLALLLGSVLYTQGATGPDSAPGVLATQPVLLKTGFSYRKLAEVQRALTTTGSGRYEIVKDAFDQGIFQDLRLLPFAIQALNDPYVEIADFAKDKILPAYGHPVAAHLLKSFDPAGGKSESRKLHVIGSVGGEETLELIYQAAEKGSDEVRTTAIGLLSGHALYEDALLNWTKDKKRVIREAAFNALAAGGSAKGAERLYEAFAGKDMELAAYALSGNEAVDARIVHDFGLELKKAAGVRGDKKQEENLRNRLQYFRIALSDNYSDALTQIYKEVLKDYSFYISLSWLDLIDWAVIYAERLNSPDALSLLQEVAKHNIRYLPNAFRLAFRLLSPEQLFDQYAGSLINKLKAVISKDAKKREQKVLETIEEMLISRTYRTYEAVWNPSSGGDFSFSSVEMAPYEEIATYWDPRWLQWFLLKEKLELVSVFARPGEPAVLEFMLHKLENNPEFRNKFAGILLMGLERAGAAPAVRQEALMAALEDKSNTNCYIFDIYVFEQLCRLPASYQVRLEAVLPSYKYEAGEQLLYAVRTISGRGEN